MIDIEISNVKTLNVLDLSFGRINGETVKLGDKNDIESKAVVKGLGRVQWLCTGVFNVYSAFSFRVPVLRSDEIMRIDWVIVFISNLGKW